MEGASKELKKNNIGFDVLFAPGCFEIPFLISKNIKRYKGFIALGCVIRGETYHFDLIANECARKIIDISNASLKPIGFGILTCDNLKQAIVRSDVRKKNKGKEPPVFLSTHPSSKKRIENLKNWINEVIIKYPPIKT